jgi:hypothetical protein
MSLENQISTLANQIYNKVISFIENNKNDDDLYYKFAYLKLNNGMIIIFDFEKKILYVTDKDEIVFSNIPNYNIKIIDDETEIWTNELRFNTSLIDKIEKCENESIKHHFEELLKKQQNMPSKSKEKIKEYYEQLNKEIEHLQYDSEKTHSADNFNDDYFDAFDDYMCSMELEKLNQQDNKILPAVQTAVDWWAKTISNNIHDGNIENDSDSKHLMTSIDILFPISPISEEQLTIFKNTLTKKLMKKIYENNGEVVQIICDYHTDLVLYDSLKEANISIHRIPPKTNMYIKTYYVGVKKGHGSKVETIFDSIKEEDTTNFKKQYFGKQNQNEKVKRLEI